MTDVNRSLDANDVTVPDQEISVPVTRSVHGMDEQAPEVQPNDARTDSAPATPRQLDWWLAEKFFWAQGRNGGWYLSPFKAFLDYVVEKSARASEFGQQVIYPRKAEQPTEEAELVKQAVQEITALRQTLVALMGETDANALDRFLVERATRNGVYSATTQFELKNWAEKAGAAGKDASDNSNYGEKESRRDTFARNAGAFRAIIRELPGVQIDDESFAKMARRHIYDQARMEGNKLRTPATRGAEAAAGSQAAAATAEAF
jgi:hypothetical protein